MSSLAESLGLSAPEAQVDTHKSRKLTAKKFSELILDSDEYRKSIERRIAADALPPAVESLLWHYRYGKPVDKIDIRDKTNDLSGQSTEQLESRAMALMEAARRLREGSLKTEN